MICTFKQWILDIGVVVIMCGCRVKRVSKMTEKVATGILSGVVKVSGYLTGSVVNSKMGKKFFNLLPGEVVLASLDGFSMLIFLSIYFLLNLLHKSNFVI